MHGEEDFDDATGDLLSPLTETEFLQLLLRDLHGVCRVGLLDCITSVTKLAGFPRHSTIKRTGKPNKPTATNYACDDKLWTIWRQWFSDPAQISRRISD